MRGNKCEALLHGTHNSSSSSFSSHQLSTNMIKAKIIQRLFQLKSPSLYKVLAMHHLIGTRGDFQL